MASKRKRKHGRRVRISREIDTVANEYHPRLPFHERPLPLPSVDLISLPCFKESCLVTNAHKTIGTSKNKNKEHTKSGSFKDDVIVLHKYRPPKYNRDQVKFVESFAHCKGTLIGLTIGLLYAICLVVFGILPDAVFNNVRLRSTLSSQKINRWLDFYRQKIVPRLDDIGVGVTVMVSILLSFIPWTGKVKSIVTSSLFLSLFVSTSFLAVQAAIDLQLIYLLLTLPILILFPLVTFIYSLKNLFYSFKQPSILPPRNEELMQSFKEHHHHVRINEFSSRLENN